MVRIKLWLSMDFCDLNALPIRAWMARGALLLLLVPLFGATCSDGSTRQMSATSEESHTTAPVTVSSAESGDGAGASVEPESMQAPNSGTGVGVVVTADELLPAAETSWGTDQPELPPDIFAIMLGAGYAVETEQDLADYLPIPPRAEGQVGRFLIDVDVVTVARVTYPEAIFADPHERWIRERMTLLPNAHERVVRRGATVLHIRADSDRRADEVQSLFLGVSAPDTPTPETLPDDGS